MLQAQDNYRVELFAFLAVNGGKNDTDFFLFRCPQAFQRIEIGVVHQPHKYLEASLLTLFQRLPGHGVVDSLKKGGRFLKMAIRKRLSNPSQGTVAESVPRLMLGNQLGGTINDLLESRTGE